MRVTMCARSVSRVRECRGESISVGVASGLTTAYSFCSFVTGSTQRSHTKNWGLFSAHGNTAGDTVADINQNIETEYSVTHMLGVKGVWNVLFLIELTFL
jgi:hypothetical protein